MNRSRPETHQATGIRFSAEFAGLQDGAVTQSSEHTGVAYHQGAARYRVRLAGSVNAPLTYPQSREGEPPGSRWQADFDIKPHWRRKNAKTVPYQLRPTGQELPGGDAGPTVTTRGWILGQFERDTYLPHDAVASDEAPDVELEDVLD